MAHNFESARNGEVLSSVLYKRSVVTHYLLHVITQVVIVETDLKTKNTFIDSQVAVLFKIEEVANASLLFIITEHWRELF